MSRVLNTPNADPRCPACAFEFQGHHDRCPQCDRLLGDATAHRMKRLASLIFGLLTQVMVGMLAWYFPPGASVGSWVLYLALGVLGVVQIVWGAGAWRHAGPAVESPAPTAKFQPRDIPFHAKSCPACGHSLARVIERGSRRCPECGGHFSLRDLGWADTDPHGEPAALAPCESRVHGPVLVAIIVSVFVLMVLGFWATLTMTPSTPQPGPTTPTTP